MPHWCRLLLQGHRDLRRLGAQVALCRITASERSTERCCRWTCTYCKEKHAGLALDMQRRDASLLEGICMRTNLLQFPFPFCLPPGVPRGKSGGGDSACTTRSAGAVTGGRPGRVLGRSRRNLTPSFSLSVAMVKRLSSLN